MLLAGEEYFKKRNNDEKFKVLKDPKVPMIRENIEEGNLDNVLSNRKKVNKRSSTISVHEDGKQEATRTNSNNVLQDI